MSGLLPVSRMNARIVLLPALLSAAVLAAGGEASPGGRPPPDDFFVKPQFTTRFEMAVRGGGQKTATALWDEIATNGYACGVFLLECRWATHPGAMAFDPVDFPDPDGLFAHIRAKGGRPLVTMSCFVSPDSREYRRFRYDPDAGGLDHLLCRADDSETAIVRWRDGYSALWDLTKPMAFGYLLDMMTTFRDRHGIDGFAFDALVPAAIEGCRFRGEGQGTADYLRLYGRFARYVPYALYPATNVMDGARTVARLPERRQAWADLRRIIPEMIALGRRGVPFGVPDGIGGGDPAGFRPGRRSEVDAKLFVRSCALQALMPMMQFACAPWRVLPAAENAICRDFARLHMKFAPYILEQARHAARTGKPIVRAMEDAFPGQGFDRPLQQFMLGSRYLVAPVVTADGAVTVEIPAGVWKDPRGMTVEGPRTLELKDVPLSYLPYFERQ